MANQYLFRFDEEGLDRIIQKVEEFRRTIREVGQAGQLGEGFQRFFNQFIAGTRNSTKTIRDLRTQVEQLVAQLQSSRLTSELDILRRGLAAPDVTRDVARLVPGVLQGQQTGAQAQQRIQAEIAEREAEAARLKEQVEGRVVALKQEESRLNQILVNEEQRLAQEKQRQAGLAEYTNRLETQRANALSQVREVRPGGARLNQLVIERENALLDRQRQLREQLSQEIARFHRQVPQEAGQILRQEAQLTQQLINLKKQQTAIERDLAAAREQSKAAGFAEAGRLAGGATDEERSAVAERQAQAQQRQLTLASELRNVLTVIASLEQERAQNQERLAAIESGGSGLSRGASEVLNRLRQIDELLAKITTSTDPLADVFGPEIHEQLQQVQQILDSFEGREIDTLSPEEVQELSQATVQARELLNIVEGFPQEGIPLRLNEEELMASQSLLNRVLLGAARDFGRRFTATLQFAISGALLFGAQRLLREFFNAAVEVERTFADISTSLEFDIDAERGTAEFERQLERVRRQVLQIADDFNALPTEVNAAAFQMVSRFQDIEAAMIATRAQVLATRIATIRQDEALRSLTGVAEAYGLSLANIADDQERERRQAQLYADALDKATAVQQQFGVSVEDTLDGAAGLAELFRTLGFTIDETFGIVAATVLRTGQTGAQVSDRLGRAFSALATPELRNELLSLANQFDDFFLRPVDFFDSGATAFFKIVDQFADLDQNLQNRLAQILGQRRETAFISALLQAAGEGEVDRVIDVVGGAAGAAENRLAVLLATVQGTIEGVSTEFQELAQNLEALGVITPIRVLLSGLEGVLKLINAILMGAIRLVEGFNRIRIPLLDWGLGDALTTMLALVTAAVSLRTLMEGIKLVAQARGANTLIDIVRSVAGFDVKGQGGRAANVGAAAGSMLGFSSFGVAVKQADSAIGKLGVGIKTLLLAPLRLVSGLIGAITLKLYAWNAALIAGNSATAAATTAEAGLMASRARTAIQLGIIAAQGLVANASLAGIGAALLRFGGVLLRMPSHVLGVVGAIMGLQGGFNIITQFVRGLFDDPSAGTRAIQERTEALQAEAQASGEVVSVYESRLKAVTERLNELGTEIEKKTSDFATFIQQALFFLPGRTSEIFPGSEFALRAEQGRLEVEGGFAQLQELQALLDSFNRRLGGTSTEIAPTLEPAQERLSELFDQFAAIDIDALDSDDIGQLQEAVRNVQEMRAMIPEAGALFDDIADLMDEWGEVLTPQEIRDAISRLQSNLQLGFISVEEAREELSKLRADALEGLAQAEHGGDPEAIKEQERVLLDIALNDQQLFEQERDARLERAALIDDTRARALAELNILKDFAEQAANNPGIGPEAVKKAQQDVADAERTYNQALFDEAIARLQFDADNARTFRDRIKALQKLQAAIRAQILARIAVNIIFGGISGITAAEMTVLADIERRMADEQLRHAVLVARNSTLRNKSALDEIAAIAATANALRAEIAHLKRQGADRQEVLAKEIELRDAIAQQRLAEADRRAAFFRLTAGTGDEIKAAQAELRAAQDRLATIEALGGADTQAGYEAELAVLQARQRLADMALRLSDARRRATSDITDSYAQALLDVHAAQEALRKATGEIEKLEAEIELREAESRAQREFYDRRLSDLDFLFQTDQIGRTQYISALRALQAGIDRTTRQGEELWREIELQIRGLMDSADQAFNIPTEIRLPTLFEVRRALAADALGVNYQDMRTQEINIFVSDEVDVNAVIAAIDQTFGSSIDLEAQRLASGGAGITIGGFS